MSLTRRGLITAGASLAGAGLAGCGLSTANQNSSGGGSRTAPVCVARGELERHRTLDDHPLVYEISARRSTFAFDAGFHGQLERWLGVGLNRTGMAKPNEVWTYGSWIDGGSSCDSWHHSGRAFDLSQLRRGRTVLVSCRYDQWSSGRDIDRQRNRYWAVAATLLHDFDTVLTYLYNAQHHNHIHVDNGGSGAEPSIFRRQSRAQLQAVQAICTYLWDRPLEITGRYDSATRSVTGEILDRLDIRSDLDDDAGWRGFLRASAARYPKS